MLETSSRLFPGSFPALRRAALETLQVNLGYVCNQQCQHCHVNAGPNRREVMSEETLTQLRSVIDLGVVQTLDLTGGAPELNPGFRALVRYARERGLKVIDRCNLSILSEPGQEDLAAFLAQHQVEVVASLPCYLEENVDRQRGKGVFNASVAGLQQLNALGYGRQTERVLNLVYNPIGAHLPPPQQQLEVDYRERLSAYGIVFSQLLTIANMPIQRFGSMLASKGEFDGYMDLLKGAHSDANLSQVMCRRMISVDWQGYLYDCDFNQMLKLPLAGGSPVHIAELQLESLTERTIAVADHCFGCTAGQGSSCGGALA